MLVWCSMGINLLEEGNPWYSVLLSLLLSLGSICFFSACVAYITLEGYRGVIEYFSEAWKDFIVEVEASNVPVEAPFEGV